jgi:class 3 adenylate cyclase
MEKIYIYKLSMKPLGFSFLMLAFAFSLIKSFLNFQKMIQFNKEKEAKLSRYFSPEVLKTIIKNDLSLGGEVKEVSTLFADIVGFTSYASNHPPEVVLKELNRHLEIMANTVFEFGGTLDKYIGDAIMAFWGAPTAGPEDEWKAVQCALVMNERIRNLKGFQLRIGVHTGPTLIGNVGSAQRMEYTVIGDSVNLASRIQSHSPPGKVGISLTTFESVAHHLTGRSGEEVEMTLKGKSQPVRVILLE